MFSSSANTRRFHVLSQLIAAAAAASASVVACGGQTTGSSAGANADAEGNPRGPGSSSTSRPNHPGLNSPGMTVSSVPYDWLRCELQRRAVSRSTPSTGICAWEGVLPCSLDGGIGDAGTDTDADTDAGEVADPSSISPLTAADVGRPEASRCVELCDSIRPTAFTTGQSLCWVSSDEGALVLRCGACGVGRPPRGFAAEKVEASSVAAAWLAEMSQLEAASVDAFHALHEDLARLGAPSSLLGGLRIAAADEVRHADLTRREAERLGAVVPPVRALSIAPRTVEQLAHENAEEGCVKETFGAVLACMQAARATDPSVRALMEQLAADELGHAVLSWNVAAWLETQLDELAHARVAETRLRTVDALDDELAQSGSGVPELGLPDSASLRRALASVRDVLAHGVAA